MFKHSRVGRLHTFSIGRLRLKLWTVKPRRALPRYADFVDDRYLTPISREHLAQ